MTLNRQGFFLVTVTLGAFAIGTATGSFLTFTSGTETNALVNLASVADEGPSAQTSQAAISLGAAVEGRPDDVAGMSAPAIVDTEMPLQSPARPAVDQALTERADNPGTGLGMASSDHVQASSQADPTFPAAFPQASAINPPALTVTSDAELASIAQIAKAALTPRPWDTQSIRARRGDSMTTILKRAGVEGRQVHAALRSLRGVYDPRNLPVGQELAITAAIDEKQPAQLLSITFDLDFDHQLLITRDVDGSFTTKKVEQAKRRELVHREGEINASLYLSARHQAIPSSVTDRLIRLFSWDVDFQRDIRRGDRFETLYEEVTLEKDKSQVKGKLVYAGLELRGELIDAYLYSPENGRANYYDSKGRSLRKFLLRTPIDGARLSSHFGKRKHPVLGYTKIHKGTDFAAPRGTPIFAGGSGRIEVAGRKGTYGNYLRIRHSDTYSTAYAHLNKFAKGIKPGVRVRQGQVVAYVGTTGRSTGPHLHYEVLKNGEQVNPMKMKHPPAIQLKGTDLAAFKKEVAKIDVQRTKLAHQQRLASRSIDVKPSN